MWQLSGLLSWTIIVLSVPLTLFIPSIRFHFQVMNVSHLGLKIFTPSCFLREGTMSWAVSTTTMGVCGFITSTMSASGRRKSRGTLLETKRAFLKTTGWPAVSNDRYTSPERKHLWTYTCRGITCLHGDLLYKVSNQALASSPLSFFLCVPVFYIVLTFSCRFHHEAWHRQPTRQRPHDQYL